MKQHTVNVWLRYEHIENAEDKNNIILAYFILLPDIVGGEGGYYEGTPPDDSRLMNFLAKGLKKIWSGAGDHFPWRSNFEPL